MTSTTFDYANPPPLFDVGKLLRTIWQRRLLVAVVALGVLGAAIGYIAITKPSYMATASILVDPRDVRSTNIDSVLPGIGADSAAIASQVSVIRSRDVMAGIFADLKLADDPEYSGTGMLSSVLGLLRPPSAPSAESVFQKFLATIGVEREGLTYVITVSVKSGDPAKAAMIANAIVDRYIAGTAAQQTAATTDVNAALNTRITSLQSDVSAAERAVEEYKQKHGILDETTGGTLQSQIDQVSQQILAAQENLSQVQTKVDQAQAAGTSLEAMARLGDIASSSGADRLREDYNARAADLASAQATYGPKHPTVITAQAQLAKVRDLLSREASRIVRELQADRDAAQSNLDKLQARLDTLRQQSSASSVAQVELRQLQGRADAARTVLNDFLQRSQETSQMEGLQSSQVHVISRSVPPPDATWPKPMLILPVSAVLGLMLGCGTALVFGELSAPAASPRPAPAGPGRRPRRTTTVESSKASPVSPARRFAGLDAARLEIFGTSKTPLTHAVQTLLSTMLSSLPPQSGPYVVAFAALEDATVARNGAAIAAMGLERIGAKPLLIIGGEDVPPLDEHSFILVDAMDELAGEADLEILVLAPGEPRPASTGPDRIVFALPRPALRVLSADEDAEAVLAAG